MMWVSGSLSRSMMVLSTSVVSPTISIETFLPVLADSSRTSRGIRWNTELTGWARIAITLSFRPRVWRTRSDRMFEIRAPVCSGNSSMTCCSMAWAITSSPTMFTTRSIFSSSTRMVTEETTLDAPRGSLPLAGAGASWAAAGFGGEAAGAATTGAGGAAETVGFATAAGAGGGGAAGAACTTGAAGSAGAAPGGRPAIVNAQSPATGAKIDSISARGDVVSRQPVQPT